MRFVKIIYLLLFLMMTFGNQQLNAQANIKQYLYWFDTNYEGRVITDISPTENISLSLNIPTSNLSAGIHSISIMTMDESNVYSSPSRSLFYKFSAKQEIKAISRYEYWFDTSFDQRTAVDMIGDKTTENIVAQMDASQINEGLHQFHIRFLANDGIWSSVSSSLFYKVLESDTEERTLSFCEYWFDSDYSSRESIDFSGENPNENFISSIDAKALSSGFHKFSVRAMDNTGLWSSPLTAMIYKAEMNSEENNLITKYEYWYDNDFENRQKVILEGVNADEFIVTSLDPSGLKKGIHSLNIRIQDNRGLWSCQSNQIFYMFGKKMENNAINAYRFWVDDNSEKMKSIELDESVSPYSLLVEVDMTGTPKGEHFIHFQFRDSLNIWSSVVSEGFDKNSLPIADFDFSQLINCDSTLLSFQNNSIDGDSVTWTFGDGKTSTVWEPEHSYFTSGRYEINLNVLDTITGVDSTVTKFIDVKANSYSSINEIVCDEYISPSGKYRWFTSGFYSDTIANFFGCDSIIEIDLKVNNSSISEINEEACFSYLSPSERYLWTEDGIYYDTLINMLGCDSIIEISLQINRVDTSMFVSGNIITANVSDAQYQWINCSNTEIIEGETNRSFTASENGSYAVEITQEGCVDTSSCYSIVSVQTIENAFKNEIYVYPNPAKDLINIDFPELYNEIEIIVRDISGRVVSVKKYFSRLSISNEMYSAKGIYFIEVKVKNKGSAIFKVIKE